MFKLPSEYDPRTWTDIPRDESRTTTAMKHISTVLSRSCNYRWNLIPGACYDERSRKSLITGFDVRVAPYDLGTAIHISYETDEVEFPFIVIVSYVLKEGANPDFFISKIRIFKSDESCVEIHGEPLVEKEFQPGAVIGDFAKVIVDFVETILRNHDSDK